MSKHGFIDLTPQEGSWYERKIEALELYLETREELIQEREGIDPMVPPLSTEEAVQLDTHVQTNPSAADLAEMVKIKYHSVLAISKPKEGVNRGAVRFEFLCPDGSMPDCWLPKFTLAKMNFVEKTVWVDEKFWEDKSANMPVGVGE